MLMGIVEDFLPIDGTNAYVTTGKGFMHQEQICLVKYKLNNDGTVEIDSRAAKVIASGTHLRLGNLFNGELTYSDNGKGINTQGINSVNLNQPFRAEEGIYYTEYSEGQPKIYFNNERLFELWDNYVVAGNPFKYKDDIYFEARNSKAPEGWELWKYNIKTEKITKVLDKAANPAVFNDILFYGEWDSQQSIFIHKWKKLEEEKAVKQSNNEEKEDLPEEIIEEPVEDIIDEPIEEIKKEPKKKETTSKTTKKKPTKKNAKRNKTTKKRVSK